VTSNECIQCNRAAAVLLTRSRPMGPGEYQICVPCALRLRREQDVTISDSSSRAHGQPVLAGASTTYSPVRVNGGAGKLSERGRGNF